MSGFRQNKNIWWYLSGRYPSGRWRGWTLFTRCFWRAPGFIFKDSISAPLRRWIGCRLRGHDFVVVDEGNSEISLHCTKCYQKERL